MVLWSRRFRPRLLLPRLRPPGLVLAACAMAAVPITASAQETFARLGPVALLGDTPNHLLLGAGVFDFLDEGSSQTDGDRAAAANLELQFGDKLLFVGPAIGLTANVSGGLFGYGGLYADLALGDIIVTPLVGIGGYRQGDSKDMGGVFQFRVELGAAYAFDDGTRLGLRYAHVSNADVHDDNPSEEEFFLTYAWPF